VVGFKVKNSWNRIPLRSSALVAAGSILGLFAATGGAFAQAGGTIGAQLTAMSTEFATAGGNVAQMALYISALVVFITGVWWIYQSRMPENRESGKLGAGVAALVLTGLLIGGGSWIGKAAQTATGAAAADTNGQGTLTIQ